MSGVPAVVITRDRLRYARRCVTALARAAGVSRVHVADRGTTYPRMLAQLREWEEWGGVAVHRLGDGHPRGLWEWDGLWDVVGDGRYLVTDCDVVPGDGCPEDWVAVLDAELTVNVDRVKAGLGLRVDDVPFGYEHHGRVRAWEGRWWERRLGTRVVPLPDDARREWFTYDADVDTTPALYRGRAEGGITGGPAARVPFTTAHSLRTGHPYVARHLPWYETRTGADLPADERWYREHLPALVSHWVDPAAYEAGGAR